jgi:hypothetical protein
MKSAACWAWAAAWTRSFRSSRSFWSNQQELLM